LEAADEEGWRKNHRGWDGERMSLGAVAPADKAPEARNSIEKVCIIGLGEVGLPTARHFVDLGFETWGYDLKEDTVNSARKKGVKATTNWGDIPHDEIIAYIVCVSTGSSNKPTMRNVFDVCQKIAKSNFLSFYSNFQNNGKRPLVSIESTVEAGTCRKLSTGVFDGNVFLISCPHRLWPEDIENHGVDQVRVMGGIDGDSLNRGVDFFRKLGIPVVPARKIEVAELSKIVENAYRFLQITFAEDLAMLCSKLGLDFWEVRDACNTKWNINILEAREGIGGVCLPKDTKMYISLADSLLLSAAVKTDERYREFVSKE
jgi:nucleotide sugar dehydrogenase